MIEEKEKRDPTAGKAKGSTPGCGLLSGETLLAYLHKKSKMNRTGFLLWRKVIAVG